MSSFSFQVEVLHSGQVREYADSIYQYRIKIEGKTRKDLFRAKSFCTKFLKPSTNEHPSGNYSGSCNFPFGLNSFYKIDEIDEGLFVYTVCEPYTG